MCSVGPAGGEPDRNVGEFMVVEGLAPLQFVTMVAFVLKDKYFLKNDMIHDWRKEKQMLLANVGPLSIGVTRRYIA
jgi:hypothetical protein